MTERTDSTLPNTRIPARLLKLTRLPHNEWLLRIAELKSALDASPDDLGLANAYWEAISGKHGYDVRDGKKAIDTFQSCAFKSGEGLAQLIAAFRELADDCGELPRGTLFGPPLENLLRRIANQPSGQLSRDAAWILGFLDDDV